MTVLFAVAPDITKRKIAQGAKNKNRSLRIGVSGSCFLVNVLIGAPASHLYVQMHFWAKPNPLF